jgi:hypothetical protein
MREKFPSSIVYQWVAKKSRRGVSQTVLSSPRNAKLVNDRKKN